MHILILTLILSGDYKVTSQETPSLEECHRIGKAWLSEQLLSVDSVDFAITYTCNES